MFRSTAEGCDKPAAPDERHDDEFKRLFEFRSSQFPGQVGEKITIQRGDCHAGHSGGTSRRVCELLDQTGGAESQSADVDEMGRHQ